MEQKYSSEYFQKEHREIFVVFFHRDGTNSIHNIQVLNNLCSHRVMVEVIDFWWKEFFTGNFYAIILYPELVLGICSIFSPDAFHEL